MWEVYEALVTVTNLHTNSYFKNDGYDNTGIAMEEIPRAYNKVKEDTDQHKNAKLK